MSLLERRRQLFMQADAPSNLININAPFENPIGTETSSTTKRIFTAGTYCKGLAYSNYFIPAQVVDYQVQNGVLTITNNNVYGLAYALSLVVGNAYILTADRNSQNAQIDYAFYANDGTYLSGLPNKIAQPVTVPTDTSITVIIFRSNGSATPVTFSNIKLERT